MQLHPCMRVRVWAAVHGPVQVWARTCPVNYWSYWGYFIAASLTFWRHFTKGFSCHSELSDQSAQPFKAILPKAAEAVRVVLAKATGFLRAPSDDQNRAVKTKRNWTNQYRPQWGMKQPAERSWGEKTHTRAPARTHTLITVAHVPSCTVQYTHKRIHIYTVDTFNLRHRKEKIKFEL